MVLAVCRGLLQDAHQADDVFQATFLVLARRAGVFAIRTGLVPGFMGGVPRSGPGQAERVARLPARAGGRRGAEAFR